MRVFAALLLGAALAGSALAQQTAPPGGQRGAPADVPRDHWAFPAVDALFRAGLLRGYPDGTFRGNRMVTRYEMAGMLHQLNLSVLDMMPRLPDRPGQVAGQFVTRTEFDRLQAEVQSIFGDVEIMRRWEPDLNEVRRMYRDLFQELEQLRREIGAIESARREIRG
jgi:hypothetical protein